MNTTKVIAKIQTGEALEGRNAAGTLVVAATINEAGDAVAFTVHVIGGTLGDGEDVKTFKTAAAALRCAKDEALCCIYDAEASVTH